MKIILSALTVIFILTAIVGCGNQTIQSKKKTTEFTTDGNGQDWENFPLEYSEDLKVIYGVANDENSLNLMARFSDRHLVRMFQSRGVTLWLFDKNEEDEKIGIYFVDNKMPQMDFGGDRRSRPPRNSESQKQFKITGSFFIVKNDTIPIDEIEDIEAAVDFIDGLICFEFKIPLQNDKYLPYTLLIPENKEIGVILEIAALSEEFREKMKAQMKEGMPGMRGGDGMAGRGIPGGERPGRGMKGGPGGRGERPMPDIDKKEVKFTILLAGKY